MTDQRCKIPLTRTLVVVYVVMEPPAACPHCGDAGPGWRGDEMAMCCLLCGEDWVRPLAVTGDAA
jgi:hypothetical protein